MSLMTGKLGDFCKIQNGNSIPVKKKKELFSNLNEGTSYVATKDLSLDGEIDYENGVKIPEKYNSSFKLSKKNSTLVCIEGGSAGKKIAFNTQDCFFVNKLASIYPSEKINSKYLYHYLKSNYFINQFKESLHGLIGGVSLTSIKNFKLSFPNIESQKKIVIKLDNVFNEIDNSISDQRKIIDNLKVISENIMDKILKNYEYEKTTLDNVCLVQRGSSPRPIKKFITTSQKGLNWIKIGDVNEGEKYVTSTNQKITALGAKKSRLVRKGDFILTNSMSYGRPYIINIDGYIHDGWFLLKLNDNIDKEFFYYLLSSSLVQNQFKTLAAGAVVKNISGDLVKKTIIPKINKKIQIEIREKVSFIIQNINDVITSKLKIIENYKFLRSSILNNLLTEYE